MPKKRKLPSAVKAAKSSSRSAASFFSRRGRRGVPTAAECEANAAKATALAASWRAAASAMSAFEAQEPFSWKTAWDELEDASLHVVIFSFLKTLVLPQIARTAKLFNRASRAPVLWWRLDSLGVHQRLRFAYLMHFVAVRARLVSVRLWVNMNDDDIYLVKYLIEQCDTSMLTDVVLRDGKAPTCSFISSSDTRVNSRAGATDILDLTHKAPPRNTKEGFARFNSQIVCRHLATVRDWAMLQDDSSWANELAVGQRLRCRYRSKWYSARVLKVVKTRIQVRYHQDRATEYIEKEDIQDRCQLVGPRMPSPNMLLQAAALFDEACKKLDVGPIGGRNGHSRALVALKKFAHLEELRLVFGYPRESLMRLAGHMAALTELVRGLTKLRVLAIVGGHTGAVSIASKSLERLDMRGARKGVWLKRCVCPRLRRIVFSRCGYGNGLMRRKLDEDSEQRRRPQQIENAEEYLAAEWEWMIPSEDGGTRFGAKEPAELVGLPRDCRIKFVDDTYRGLRRVDIAPRNSSTT